MFTHDSKDTHMRENVEDHSAVKLRPHPAPENASGLLAPPGSSGKRGEVGLVKRAIEKIPDKLGRSKSVGTRSQMSQSQPTLSPPQGHRRLFSLSRKGKEKLDPNDVKITEEPHSAGLPGVTSSLTSPSTRSKRVSGLPPPGDDDSPFITPHSPPFDPTRPELQTFRGNGSMRIGTQALIQALQAMPWGDDQGDDDDAFHENTSNSTPVDTESDEDDGIVNRLASSIHTLYRPVARLKRSEFLGRSRRPQSPTLPMIADKEEAIRPEEPVTSDEDLEEDFESKAVSEPKSATLSSNQAISTEPLSDLESSTVEPLRPHPGRSGSMATVKLQRRARLAEKLRGVFELDGIQEVIAEMPCWLLRSVLLQGYMYLTDSYLCFFAHMPSREDQVLKSGSMSKRAQRTKRWIRHWFVLKNDVLSWYQSPSDPYFPHGIVDLRYAFSCDPIGEKELRLRTNQKTIKLSADSIPNRDEWVKAIRKVMFKAQNMGDSVKIAIPYAAVVDVERSSAMDFSETIEVKVVDKTDLISLDSYFFAYFHDLPAALEEIRDAVRANRGGLENVKPPAVIDTTVMKPSPVSPHPTDRTQSMPALSQPRQSSSMFRLPSILRPLQESLPIGRSASTPERERDNEDFTHISKRGSSSFIAITTSPKSMTPEAGRSPDASAASSSTLTPPVVTVTHTYPPSPSPVPSMSEYVSSATKDSSLWNVGVPSWLRIPSRRSLTSAFSVPRVGMDHAATMPASTGGDEVSEVFSTSSSRHNDFGYYSILETPESTIDGENLEKFRSSFAFDDKENLLGVFPGYIFRLLPVYGRLHVSTNYFCFKSTGPLTTRTTMILPIRDILSTEKCKAFRFGHHGLVIMVRGHEEIFFEFSDEERRAAFVTLLERQIEDVRRRSASDDTSSLGLGEHEALILEESGPRASISKIVPGIDAEASAAGSLPAVMFNSTSSTFLTFKPKESLHFTFLTIGSRGDVQPYIALAKGLLADGHRVRIATHGEFKEWIESYGIEFGYVGGDPAELMRICVENGTFTVSFLREGMMKFRGWIDDLLKTSWEACKGTDVLVESPSAMGGYHIAEALRIPYFRAFTMTWTRTRAYPHAFAVPEHKMGGNYNYMSYVLFDQVFWRATAGQINRWRRNILGLPSTSLDKMEPHKIPFLYNFSPVVVPPPLDWPEWIRVTGYWFLDDADVSSKKWTPPADLEDFLATAHKAKKKVVYIGFGSIVVSDPKAMTRCVVDAVGRSGIYAILSKGWSDRLVKHATDTSEQEEPLSPQIYPISSIPHDWLFKRIDAACHHGGAGTTGASLRAGIPTIIKPFFGDQFFWADRVEALGIGSAVRKLTVDSLTEALIAATADQRQIDRARQVGEHIRAEDGVATAIEAIYRDLEYARSLIKGGVPKDHDYDTENATIRDSHAAYSPERSGTRSGESSISSAHGPASDWSVISDHDSLRQ